MESSTLIDAAVVKASETFVALVAHGPTDHPKLEVEEGGRKVERCGLYPNLDCSDHVAAGAVVADLFKGRFRLPSMVWVDGDGRELFRKAGYRRPEEMLKDLRDARAKVPGPTLGRAEYRAQQAAIEEGVAAAEAGKWRDAVRRLTSLPGKPTEAMKQRADAALAEVKAVGEQRLLEAQETMANRDRAEGLALLKAVAEDFEGLDPGTKAAALLKELDSK